MPPTLARSFCITDYPDSKHHSWPNLEDIPGGRYIVYQFELCPRTYRLHIQAYLELSRPTRLSSLKIYFPTAHLETRLGTRDQARGYCMKPETRVEGPFEDGDWDSGGQGTRNDLLAAAHLVQTEGLQAVAQQMPHLLIKFPRGLTLLHQMTQPTRQTLTTLTIYWGPPASGKSTKAFSQDLYPYSKPPDCRWWDGYMGQSTVILDDFTPDQIPLQTMLRLADRFPLQLEVKGGMVQFLATRIIITANTDPTLWYKGAPQWLRRITEVEYMD